LSSAPRERRGAMRPTSGGGPVTGKVENNQESAERKPQPEITLSPYGKENLQ
jgi:hypothetical protein